jgi:hypothetical protein
MSIYRAFKRPLTCWLGKHDYVWNGKLIPARAIKKWSRLETTLTCAYCPAQIGPQPGQPVDLRK